MISLLCLICIGISIFFIVKKRSSDNSYRGAGPTSSFDAPTAPSDQSQDHIDENRSDAEHSLSEITSEKYVGTEYPLHENITATLFWVGEEADDDNKDISNAPSAWDEKWMKHFGGVDDPQKRNGYYPKKFVPQENPFYFALPYNDFDQKGDHKKDLATVVPWANDQKISAEESILKNRWIKVIHGDKVAYAQWEDVGPFNEDDHSYVFGTAKPKSKTNDHAGLDLSPSVNDYLGLEDLDTVSWQFVDSIDVPDGPWKDIITTSGIYWK